MLPHMQNHAYLTIKEVADLLRVHHTTIRRYVRDGELPSIRLGNKLRIPRAGIAALIRPVAQPLRQDAP